MSVSGYQSTVIEKAKQQMIEKEAKNLRRIENKFK